MESMSLNEICEAYHHSEPCCRSKKNIGSLSGSQIFTITMRCQEQIRRCLGNPTESHLKLGFPKYQEESQISVRRIESCRWSFRRCTTAVVVALYHHHRRRTKSLLLLLLLPFLCSQLSLFLPFSLPHFFILHFLFLRFLSNGVLKNDFILLFFFL
ncbi:hypothetical protein NE237_008304 [Protea cynaroides]|uniref:Uncharacterized protein n=1 Tax=Protea cynaroides TaxID=273540 RepID=A0A9Q0GKG4_9MAGN|nr:hypothetical protein NE237_008304 [Protea cynaroides]